MMNNAHAIELSMADGYDIENTDSNDASFMYFAAQQDVLVDYKPYNALAGSMA